MKRGRLVLITFSLAFVLSMSLVSAGWFSDFFGKLTGTGNVVDSNGNDIQLLQTNSIDACDADFDGDGVVGDDDFALFSAEYGNVVTSNNSQYDLNGEGETIDFDDYVLFAQNYGKECVVEGAEEVEETTCVDSDGGQKPYIQGIVNTTGVSSDFVYYHDKCVTRSAVQKGQDYYVEYNGVEYEYNDFDNDSCSAGSNCFVAESYCSSNKNAWIVEPCLSGCSLGTCLGVSAPAVGKGIKLGLNDYVRVDEKVYQLIEVRNREGTLDDAIVFRDRDGSSSYGAAITSEGNGQISLYGGNLYSFSYSGNEGSGIVYLDTGSSKDARINVISSYGSNNVTTGDRIKLKDVYVEAIILESPTCAGIDCNETVLVQHVQFWDVSLGFKRSYHEIGVGESVNLIKAYQGIGSAKSSEVNVTVESISIVRDGQESNTIKNSNTAEITLIPNEVEPEPTEELPDKFYDRIIAEDIGDWEFVDGDFEEAEREGDFVFDGYEASYFTQHFGSNYPGDYATIAVVFDFNNRRELNGFLHEVWTQEEEGLQILEGEEGYFLVNVGNDEPFIIWTDRNIMIGILIEEMPKALVEEYLSFTDFEDRLDIFDAFDEVLLAYQDKYSSSDLNPSDFEDKNIPLVCDSGCELNNQCVPLGYRTRGEFCDLGSEFSEQKTEGQQCLNNFECDSNVCVSGECVSGSLVQKIIEWFRAFFGN